MTLPRGSTFRAGADGAQVIEGVNAGVVPVVPVNPDGVRADFLNGVHAKPGLEHLKGTGGWRGRASFRGIVRALRLSAVRAGARGTRALVPQQFVRVHAGVPVGPIDGDSARFRNRDVEWGGRSWTALHFQMAFSVLGQYRARPAHGASWTRSAPVASCPGLPRSFRRRPRQAASRRHAPQRCGC